MSERKYKSRYGADSDITDGQFLTEFICERIARKEKKTLIVKFWNSSEWNKIFRAQITHANKLLKKYSCLEIANALKSKRGLSIYSLGNKKPIEAIIEASKKIQASQGGFTTIKDNVFDVEFVDESEVESKIVEKKKNLWNLLGD